MFLQYYDFILVINLKKSILAWPKYSATDSGKPDCVKNVTAKQQAVTSSE